jgi:hypothetical protein
MSNYAIIPNRGIYYFSKRKKTKFVPLFKICKVNGTTVEEFQTLINQIEITLKNGTTKQQTNPRQNSLGGGHPGRDTN